MRNISSLAQNEQLTGGIKTEIAFVMQNRSVDAQFERLTGGMKTEIAAVMQKRAQCKQTEPLQVNYVLHHANMCEFPELPCQYMATVMQKCARTGNLGT